MLLTHSLTDCAGEILTTKDTKSHEGNTHEGKPKNRIHVHGSGVSEKTAGLSGGRHCACGRARGVHRVRAARGDEGRGEATAGNGAEGGLLRYAEEIAFLH